MRIVAEFTSEPFHGEDTPPAHAVAALQALEAHGLTADFGPLGTSVAGEADEVVAALADVLRASLAEGATRVTLQVELPGEGGSGE